MDSQILWNSDLPHQPKANKHNHLLILKFKLAGSSSIFKGSWFCWYCFCNKRHDLNPPSLEWPALSGGSRGGLSCVWGKAITHLIGLMRNVIHSPSNWAKCQYWWQLPANAITHTSAALQDWIILCLSGHFLPAFLFFSQPLHINAANEAYILQRPSSLFWCHSIKSLSCLEISSVTLTPMSSPESNLSAGLLTPPPAKPALLPPKPTEGCSIPRPRVNTLCFFFLSVLSCCL